MIFSPDVLITEGPHMCTHSWIFLDFYRLRSSNCVFTLWFVAAVWRCSAKAAEAEADGRGPGTGDAPQAASLRDAPRRCPEQSLQAASLQSLRHLWPLRGNTPLPCRNYELDRVLRKSFGYTIPKNDTKTPISRYSGGDIRQKSGLCLWPAI